MADLDTVGYARISVRENSPVGKALRYRVDIELVAKSVSDMI